VVTLLTGDDLHHLYLAWLAGILIFYISFAKPFISDVMQPYVHSIDAFSYKKMSTADSEGF
jgi:hypothetical protein